MYGGPDLFRKVKDSQGSSEIANNVYKQKRLRRGKINDEDEKHLCSRIQITESERIMRILRMGIFQS